MPTKESRVEPEKELTDIEFTVEKTKKKLDNLRTDAAGGPDGIPPRILKEFSAELSKPLTILYRRSMEEGEIPEEWRESQRSCRCIKEVVSLDLQTIDRST